MVEQESKTLDGYLGAAFFSSAWGGCLGELYRIQREEITPVRSKRLLQQLRWKGGRGQRNTAPLTLDP